MMAENASLDAPGHPTKDAPTRRGRDARKGAQDDGSTESINNPPDHGLPTHSVARFLWDVPKNTPIDELPDLYDRWEAGEDLNQRKLTEVEK